MGSRVNRTFELLETAVVNDTLGFTRAALNALRLHEAYLEAQADDAAQLAFQLFLQAHHGSHVIREVFILHLHLQFAGIGIVDAIDGEQEVRLILWQRQDDSLNL